MPEQQRLPKEIRFAVVMYGGVSLAIYINGVTQELMSMVRATARRRDDPNRYHIDKVSGVEEVYRRLGERLNARFVVDILAGTSAGGINAVYLAKALANDQSIEGLKKLWIEEGDIGLLINDRQSLKDLDGLPSSASTTSLLNSQRMYYQLLRALQDMENDNSSLPTEFSPYVEELDLFITATDLHGLSVPLYSSRRELARERRYRNVFQFRYCTPTAAGSTDSVPDDSPLNEFLEKFDPFLAFAARCTSSFPFAFEPMRLEDVGRMVGRWPFIRYTYNVEEWSHFFKDYPGTFPQMSFADGGYLDNKPFSYATATLSRRRADLPVDRKLIYIEPAPELGDQDSRDAAAAPDALENVVLALTKLPRYESIREDLDVVNQRNRVIQNVNTVLRNIETIYTADMRNKKTNRWVARKQSESQKDAPPWRQQYLNELIKVYGAGYIPYHELRVQEVLQNLATMMARGMGWAEESPRSADLLLVLHEWRRVYYKSHSEEADLFAEIPRRTENDLLFRLDSGWYIRRLHYLKGLIDILLKDLDDNRLGADGSASKSILDHSDAAWQVQPENRIQYHEALVRVKTKLNDAFALLRGKGRALRRRNLVSMKSTPDAAFQEYRSQLEGLKTFLEASVPFELIPAMLQPDIAIPMTQLEVLVKFITRKARIGEPDSQIPPGYMEALKRFEDIAYALTQPDPKGLLFSALEQTSNMVQVAVGRPPRSEELGGPSLGNDPLLQQVQESMGFYDDHFEDFDMLTRPISYGTDVGESDEVEIVRISPLDATMIKGPDYGNRKLAGIKLGNFGAFFHRDWRENDMLWGRLDAIECLIRAVWPEGEGLDERNRFINQAHDILIDEFMLERNRKLLMHGLSQTRSGQTKAQLAAAASALLPDTKELNRSFREDYEPERDLPPDSTLQAIARSTTVMGKLMGTLSDKYPVVSEPAGIVARTGNLLFFVVSLALPRNLMGQLFRRISSSIYLLGFSIMAIGTILNWWNLTEQGTAWNAFGARIVFTTLAIQLVIIILSLFMTSRLNLKTATQRIRRILSIVLALVAVVFIVALLVASYSGLIYLGVWEAPTGTIGLWLEGLKRFFNP